MKKILILVFIVQLLFASCAGQKFSYNPFPQRMHAPSTYNSTSTEEAETIDKEFEIKDYDKEGFNEKSGYVLLGIIGVAATLAAIVIPIVLLNDKF